MKVLKAIILFLTIGLLAGACSDDSDLGFPSNFPTVFVEEGTSFNLQVGKVLQVHINIESETIMESMEVYKNGNLFQHISLEPSYNLRHQYQFQGMKEDVGSQKLTFVVIDRDGVGAAESIEVEVYETPLTFTANASITNANGNGLISWDLVLNEGKSVGNKVDVLNSSTPISGWVKGWKASTLTKFAKLTSAPATPLDELTLEDITALFNQNTSTTAVSNLATDDWLIAKIRNSEEYTIIQITHVDEQFDNATERIDFMYKKTYEFAGRE